MAGFKRKLPTRGGKHEKLKDASSDGDIKTNAAYG